MIYSMGLLQSYDEPITKEFLLKEEFSTRLFSDQLAMRYDLANMSRDEFADMIESNIFYEKNVYDVNHRSYIRITYWPDSYHAEHYDVNGKVLHAIANVYKNTDSSTNKLKDCLDCMYNLQIDFFGNSVFSHAMPMRSLVSTTRELLDFIALAEVQAEELQKMHSSAVNKGYC